MNGKRNNGYVKLQIKGGQANPAPPVGPALGQRGIKLWNFVKPLMKKQSLYVPVPVVITVYKDKNLIYNKITTSISLY